SGQVESQGFAARVARNQNRVRRHRSDGSVILSSCKTRVRRGARRDGSLARGRLKKGPGGSFDTATEARPTRHGDDKPGLARSGRRAGSVFHAHEVRWGHLGKVPGAAPAFLRNSRIRRARPQIAENPQKRGSTFHSLPYLDSGG